MSGIDTLIQEIDEAESNAVYYECERERLCAKLEQLYFDKRGNGKQRKQMKEILFGE